MIACVVPTIRPDQFAEFDKAWSPLLDRHNVVRIVVWDGDEPTVTIQKPGCTTATIWDKDHVWEKHRGLFCRHSDVIRNLGFVAAAEIGAEYILTLDDDVTPTHPGFSLNNDPIQNHLDCFRNRVAISWMNTAQESEGLRGLPYKIRNEAPVKMSHGVWCGVPDFDGETQQRLEKSPRGLPATLQYYRGSIPRGVRMPICGMNVMIHRDALPFFYFAPMGPDCGVHGLHRYGDIWMGVALKSAFDKLGWAIYTGAATVHHTRASDPRRNMELEKLARKWNEWDWLDDGHWPSALIKDTVASDYFRRYAEKRREWEEIITHLLPITFTSPVRNDSAMTPVL